MSDKIGLTGVILVAILFIALEAWAKKVTLGPFRTLEGEYSITFESSTFPEEHMKKLVLLSPPLATDYALAPSLQLCSAGDPEYVACGTRNLHATNFFRNAEVNLKRGRKSLDFLNSLKYPNELKPVITYLQKSLSFSLWTEETLYEFYKSWDTNILRKKHNDLDAQLLCPSILKDIDVATSKQSKYDLARSKWSNCLNDVFRTRLGNYPVQDWTKFVAAYGIEEGSVAKRLWQQAEEFERKTAYDKAIATYTRIIKEHPEDTYEDDFASGKYSDMARDRIKALKCLKTRGQQFSTKTPQELASLVERALQNENEKELMKYASCDFDVGALESDNIWPLLPEEAIPVILKSQQGINFTSSLSKKIKEGLWVVEFSSASNKDRYAFFFRKKENKWVWTSFATSSDLLLDALYLPKRTTSK